MDDGVRDELTRLRARAYGPAADIGSDPAALARLVELEERERLAHQTADAALAADRSDIGSAATLSSPAADRPASAPPASATVPLGAAAGSLSASGARGAADDASGGDDAESDMVAANVDAGLTDEADEADEAAGAGRGRARRLPVRSTRSLWLWAATVAAVAAVASAATAVGTAFAPVSRSAGVAQVDTIEVDPAFVVPTFFGPASEGALGFRDFLGLTVMVGSQQIDPGEDRSRCLYVVDSDDVSSDRSSFQGGFIFGGCGAGVFPPTAQFVVSEQLPDAVRERFPVGTSLQFVLDGERVGVFSDQE